MDKTRLISSSSMYFIVFLILNYIIFLGLSFTFNIAKNELYYLIILLLALSQPLSLLLLRFSSSLLIRALYAASAAWLGISAYILILLAIYLIIGYLVNIPAQTAGILIVGAALIISIYALFNVTRIKIEEINIPFNIEENIRAVQISDVHIGPIRKEGFVRRMVDKIIELDPEIVFITGDIFDGSTKIDDDILKDFNRIKVPVIFIMGNHDFYQGFDEVNQYMKVANINILYNQVFQFKGVQIIGVPFSWDRKFLEKSITNIDFDKKKPTILLYHLPREFQVAIDAGIDLQLSGHTHAGQFYPFNLFVKLMFPYLRGLYKKEGSYLYVSQGTGTLGPPMRLGSRCEITLINLNASEP
jgi:predicted MPP superfamily phosphohydrolase